jgi:hypothetical protein
MPGATCILLEHKHNIHEKNYSPQKKSHEKSLMSKFQCCSNRLRPEREMWEGKQLVRELNLAASRSRASIKHVTVRH